METDGSGKSTAIPIRFEGPFDRPLRNACIYNYIRAGLPAFPLDIRQPRLLLLLTAAGLPALILARYNLATRAGQTI